MLTCDYCTDWVLFSLALNQDGSDYAVRGAQQAVRQGLHQARQKMHET